MPMKLASRQLKFQWNTDKYLEDVPIIHKITQLIDLANVTETLSYNTLLYDEFETEMKLVDLVKPELDYMSRIIICNKAIIQKGNVRSVEEFLDALGITSTIIVDNLKVTADLSLNDFDLEDPGYFRDLISKLIYELLFYGDIERVKIISITFNFEVKVVSSAKYYLSMINNISEGVIYATSDQS